MTFDDFIGKWNDRGIDFDGYYGNQCMDLMHQYIVEVLGLTDGRILAADTAKDVYLKFSSVIGNQYFEKIDNTPTGVPQKGDIMFWGQTVGTAGHVAIYLDGDVNKFRSFDQNWPTGSKCHLQNHDYSGVIGWLRLKPEAKTIPVLVTDFENMRTKCDKYDPMAAAGYPDLKAIDKKVGELTTENTNLKKQIQETSQENADLLAIYKKKLESDATAIDAGLKAEKDLEELTKDMDAIKKSLGLTSDVKASVVVDKILELKKPNEQAAKEYQKLFDLVFEEGLGVYKKLKTKKKSIIEKFLKKVGR